MRAIVLTGLTALLLVALRGPLQAQTPDSTAPAAVPPAGAGAAFTAQMKPELAIRRAPGPIVLDGALDDAGWVGAARATGFSEAFPNQLVAPPVESEVLVTYDDEHLYLGFIAFDDDPAAIRATLRDRDQMFSDDYFGILLDTYGDASWAYFLFANPRGVQGDSRFSSTGGEDDGFDLVYRSEARITDQGYQIEMAIPFQSLRFPSRPVQTWRATFWRTRPRASRETHSWAAITDNEPCALCQFGTLTGIEGVEPGGALELFPAVVASQAGSLEDPNDPDSDFENDGFEAEASLGARYAFPFGLTAEGAINPDFSQVESDVAQIDVNQTFALFFPERRPFFQEGSDLFDSVFNVVYTRQINDPQAAVKLIGRLGRSSVAYLGARDFNSPVLLPFEERSFVSAAGRSLSNILRLRRTYGSNSFVGAMVTDRRLESGDGAGTAYGVDGTHRFLDKYQFEYQLLGSHTQEPDAPAITAPLGGLTFDDGAHTAAYDGETFSGAAYYASLERGSRRWNFDVDYWASSPTFRADNGFEFRNDFRRLSMSQNVNFYPGVRGVDRITPSVYAQRRWTYDNEQRSDFLRTQLQGSLTRQTFVSFGYNFDQERFRGINFTGIRNWDAYVETNFGGLLEVELELFSGDEIARNQSPPLLGKGRRIALGATFRPIDRLTIEPSVQHSRLRDPATDEEIFSGYIARTRTSFSFSRQLFLRLVVQYNDFDEQVNVEPLLTYKINPFTLFYVGAAQVYEDFPEHDQFSQSARQFFAKFQYLFQL